MVKGYLTTAEVAQRLGISDARVRRMILDGLITSDKAGRAHLISDTEVQRVEKLRRKAGRPATGPKGNK
jgi:excisionase family DNA binding protein